jgi:hypothetical protein
MKLIKLRAPEDSNPQSHSKGISRTRLTRSTHLLDELSKSCVDEISAMSDFRKVLLENRHKMKSIRQQQESVVAQNGDDSVDDATNASSSVPPVEAADRKLTKISISFDSQSYNSHLAGFSGSMLNKQEFSIQLRRCLNINLRKIEMDALFEKMDVDNSGLIDGVEFVRYFFALGKQARAAVQRETMELREKKLEKTKERAKEKLEK